MKIFTYKDGYEGQYYKVGFAFLLTKTDMKDSIIKSDSLLRK